MSTRPGSLAGVAADHRAETAVRARRSGARSSTGDGAAGATAPASEDDAALRAGALDGAGPVAGHPALARVAAVDGRVGPHRHRTVAGIRAGGLAAGAAVGGARLGVGAAQEAIVTARLLTSLAAGTDASARVAVA